MMRVAKSLCLRKFASMFNLDQSHHFDTFWDFVVVVVMVSVLIAAGMGHTHFIVIYFLTTEMKNGTSCSEEREKPGT